MMIETCTGKVVMIEPRVWVVIGRAIVGGMAIWIIAVPMVTTIIRAVLWIAILLLLWWWFVLRLNNQVGSGEHCDRQNYGISYVGHYLYIDTMKKYYDQLMGRTPEPEPWYTRYKIWR
jgi:hypothetical protein